MFKTSLIESGGDSPRGKPKLTVVVSLLLHVTVVALLVIVPMWFATALPQGELVTFLFSPAPPPPPPPPPLPPAISGKRLTVAAARVARVDFISPEKVPDKILPPSDEPPEVVDIGSNLLKGPGGVSPGGVGNPGPGVSPGLMIGHKVTTPPPPPPPPTPRVPQRIGGKVLASKLIKRVEPVYPELAKRAHAEGMVILQVMVNEMGVVEDVTIIRGHPLLTDAAVQAVRQWVYTPTLLNQEPVPVIATVTVNFTLRR